MRADAPGLPRPKHRPPKGLPPRPRPPQSNTKKTVSGEEWARKLAAVRVKKEDMNRLIMNFLVTEVGALRLAAASGRSPCWGVTPAGKGLLESKLLALLCPLHTWA